jgi:multisubunit Na+/H+ antiporter MnhE subunit
MLIPRFSLKVLLIGTVLAAVVAYVLREAVVQTEPWAIALCMTLLVVALVFAFYILLWMIAWVWEQVGGKLLRRRPPTAGNPFASAGPPRQVVSPSEPPL